MQDLRKKLIIIVVILAVFLVSILLIAMLADDSIEETQVEEAQQEQVEQDAAARVVAPEVTPKPSAPVVPVVVEDPGEQYARQSAKIVIERLGSYSNQNENRHIDDVKSLLTASMYSYTKEQLTAVQGNEYSGVTTQVVTSKVVSFDDATAEVEVGVQRRSSTASETNMTYQTGTVRMVKQGSSWLVNGIYWQE
ncbi:MAG: hypothetical protein HOE53_04885 [Candidatus Magasanikbacteria bacterium]|jgi:hypothetical protein|nr:hypothetical protein [Candidatus Magasanikbacteria bacterium]